LGWTPPEIDVEENLSEARIALGFTYLVDDRPNLLVARSCETELHGERAETAIGLSDRTLAVVDPCDRGDEPRA
jgi:hypothetical protein